MSQHSAPTSLAKPPPAPLVQLWPLVIVKMLSQLLLCQLPSWKKAPEHIEPAKDAKPAWMISTGMTASCGLVLEGSCTTAVPSAVPASASTIVEDNLLLCNLANNWHTHFKVGGNDFELSSVKTAQHTCH